MKKIIISVTNDLTTDQRVDKVATSLVSAGFSVFLIGRSHRKASPLNNRKYDSHRFKMFFSKGFLFYFEFNIRLFCFLLTSKCDILLSNDLDTLCANFLISKLRKIKLVYDSHELFTEVPELLNRPITKFIWLSMENFFLKRIKFSYTVSESIASYYRERYGIKMSVISNFPVIKSVKNNSKKSKNFMTSV